MRSLGSLDSDRTLLLTKMTLSIDLTQWRMVNFAPWSSATLEPIFLKFGTFDYFTNLISYGRRRKVSGGVGVMLYTTWSMLYPNFC